MEVHHSQCAICLPWVVQLLICFVSLDLLSPCLRLSPGFLLSSPSLPLPFCHSLALSFAPASPSPELKCMLELFLSWIMRINCRGQMEWVSRDNDWSDGTWAPPDCGVSELVIKRQGGGRWVLTVSFKHYECQKRQCQNGPVFSLALYSPAPSTSLSGTNNSFVISLFIQAEEEKKKKKNVSSSLGHMSMYSIYKLNLWLSDSHIGQPTSHAA